MGSWFFLLEMFLNDICDFLKHYLVICCTEKYKSCGNLCFLGTPWPNDGQWVAHIGTTMGKSKGTLVGKAWHTMAAHLASEGTSMGNVGQWVAHVGTTFGKRRHIGGQCWTMGGTRWHHPQWASKGTSFAPTVGKVSNGGQGV